VIKFISSIHIGCDMKIKLLLSVLIVIISSCSNKQAKVTTISAEKTNAPLQDSLQPVIVAEQKKTESKEPAKKEEHISVLSATSQSWVAGIPSGGSGTEYYFNTVIHTNRKLVFDTAWIANRAFGLFVSNNSKSISSKPVTYSKGDTIMLRISDLKNKGTQKQSNPPVKLEGAALIRFTADGEKEYYTVKEIKRLEGENRP
jgi:hypothetical protein